MDDLGVPLFLETPIIAILCIVHTLSYTCSVFYHHYTFVYNLYIIWWWCCFLSKQEASPIPFDAEANARKRSSWTASSRICNRVWKWNPWWRKWGASWIFKVVSSQAPFQWLNCKRKCMLFWGPIFGGQCVPTLFVHLHTVATPHQNTFVCFFPWGFSESRQWRGASH